MYPKYPNGDVTIVLSTKKADTLVLYSGVLTTASEFFRASLSSPWLGNKASTQTKASKAGVAMTFYELIYDSELDMYCLEGKERNTTEPTNLTSEGQASTPASDTRPHTRAAKADFRKYQPQQSQAEKTRLDEAKEKQKVAILSYKVLFAWMHHTTFHIPSSTDYGALAECIATSMDYLQVAPTMTTPLEQLVFAKCAIAESPCRFLSIATKVRSRRLFDEAFKHAVGLFSDLDEADFEYVRDDRALEKLVRSGARLLHKRVHKANRELLRMVPANFDRVHCNERATADFARTWFSNYFDVKILPSVDEYTTKGAAAPYIEMYMLRRANVFHASAPAINIWCFADVMFSVRIALRPILRGHLERLSELDPAVGEDDPRDEGVEFDDGLSLDEDAYFLCAVPEYYPWEVEDMDTDS